MPTDRFRTLPAHITLGEFNKMNETIYFNSSNDGPIFPPLQSDHPGPSSERKDLDANNDMDSDLDEDVAANFDVEAHEQHIDALDDDNDLEAEGMARYLGS